MVSPNVIRRCVQGRRKKFGFVSGGGDGDVEETDHHLVVGLISPAHGDAGIGIVGIIFGIVVPGDGLEYGAGFEGTRLSESVTELPVEVVIHAEKRLGRTIGFDDVVFETFAAEMHVREKIEEHGVVGQGAVNFHAKVRHSGRDDETIVG